jgi:hypothetical protein
VSEVNDEDEGEGEGEPPRSQSVYAVFHDKVTMAGGVSFGQGGSTAPPPLTGPLADADVELACRHYVAPAGFDRAKSILASRRLTVLHGDPGIGKRAAALKLASELVGGKPIVSLSPGVDLQEIAGRSFRQRRAYVLVDWTGEAGSAQSAAFLVTRLRASLEEKQAYLVMTTASPLPGDEWQDVTVAWTIPELSELLKKHPGAASLTAKQRARVERHFDGSWSPRRVARLAEQLADAGGGAAALGALIKEATDDEVASCWDEEPSPEWVAITTATAFAYGAALPAFERFLTDLENRLWPDPEPTDDADESARSLPPGRQRLAQQRLIAVRHQRVSFTSERLRRRVVAELWSRYDRRLWDPTFAWIDQLAASGDDDILITLSLGVAMLSQAAPATVDDELLKPWAAGDRSRRAAACYTIWWLALRDESAPRALAIVVRWAVDGHEGRRRAAILAFSGPLGVRFPADAFRWLWHATSGPLRGDAIVAIADLAYATADSDSADLSIFQLLQHKLRGATDDKAPRSTVDTVTTVVELIVGGARDGAPAIARVLVRAPSSASIIVALWAENLVDRRRRGAALKALAATLHHLRRLGEWAAIERLGHSMRVALPSHEAQLFQRDLLAGLSGNRERGREIAEAIVDAMSSSRPSITESSGDIDPNEPLSDH